MRRVLTRLETEGLVEIHHGIGTIVTDPDLDTLAQVYPLRLELAALLGKLSPLPRTEADLARIRALVQRCEALAFAPDQQEFARLNMAFFFEITAISRQPAARGSANGFISRPRASCCGCCPSSISAKKSPPSAAKCLTC